jgi:dTDP-4-amino-4,6-dideoxygalactose transaminase
MINSQSMSDNKLALLGGQPHVQTDPGDLFSWPIITAEHEDAVLEVLRRGAMSGTDVTMQFENEFAGWQGSAHALAFCNGTASIQAAMFGCHVGVGDEIICPSLTYWAAALQCFSLGATMVFADVDTKTLCIDPEDIEHRITEHTKAIVVVHYCAHPADMDAIMEIARRHNIRVIEDVSHAQGGLYKGRKLGTIGDVGAMSLMSGKSFAIGEGGMLVTDDLEIYERAMAFGHYERYSENIQTAELKPYAGLPLGGCKNRMHQLSSAVGRVQLKHYDAQCVEIRRAMNYFWDLLEGVPGVEAHRVDEKSGSNMAGWYAPLGLYRPHELGGLSLSRFCAAVSAEGVRCKAGANAPLHLHPLLNDCDVYGDHKPTRIAHSNRDLRKPYGSLPVTENINNVIYGIPWFKHYRPQMIEEQAAAYRKVLENHQQLLEGDVESTAVTGRAGLSAGLGTTN